MKIGYIVILAVVILGGFLLFGGNSADNGDVLSDDISSVILALHELNNSGQTGQAQLTAVDNETRVDIVLQGAPEGHDEPIHIHKGSCDNLGEVHSPLTNVVAGESVTTLSVELDDLLDSLPLAINVHKSLDEIDSYVACGDIVIDVMKKDGDAMESDEDVMMEKDGDAMESDEDVMMEKDGDAMESDEDVMMEHDDAMEKETN